MYTMKAYKLSVFFFGFFWKLKKMLLGYILGPVSFYVKFVHWKGPVRSGLRVSTSRRTVWTTSWYGSEADMNHELAQIRGPSGLVQGLEQTELVRAKISWGMNQTIIELDLKRDELTMDLTSIWADPSYDHGLIRSEPGRFFSNH
jgi:hypothetical protein